MHKLNAYPGLPTIRQGFCVKKG